MASVPSSLEQGAEEAAGFSPFDHMPSPVSFGLRQQGDAMNLKAILVPYGFAAGCRCAACESRRAMQLAEALRNKFGRGLAPPGWRSN